MNNIKILPSLLIFAEIAKRGSYTKAANHLGISKSSASQHITRLEQQMGTQLLSRNTRGMSLTANGVKLLSRSELLKDQVDLAFRELSNAEQEPSGIFSVTFPHSIVKEIITPALRQLCNEFPKIQLRTLITDDPMDLINEKLDVAIYAGDLRDSNYRALPIGTSTELFFASPAYLQKAGSIKNIDDLKNHKWLSAEWQKADQMIYKDLHHKEKSKNPIEKKITLMPFSKSNNLSAVIEMVKQDMGYALLPNITSASWLKNGELSHILPGCHGKTWPFYFVHPFQGDKPIHISRFYQLVKHYFAKAKSI